MSNIIVKQAVEYKNGCFIEHNLNTETNTVFYSVKYPDGVTLDYKRLGVARMSARRYARNK